MDQKYIDSLTKEQRAAWGVQIFIRLWLSGMCQSQAAQNWTIAQIAILFEVSQAHLFREEPHTATSLSKELNLPIQTVSRTVRDLQKMGLVVQLPNPQNNIDSNHVDARIYLVNAAIGYVLVSKLDDMILRLAEP